MSEEETGTGKGAAGEAQIQLSPGGSHLGGPLGGVLHNRLAEAVIHVGRHLPPWTRPGLLRTLVGLLPAQRSRCLRPVRSARPPARPPEANKPNRGGGSGGRAYGGGGWGLCWAPRPGARDRRAGDPAGKRGRGKGAGGVQLQRPAVRRVPAGARRPGTPLPPLLPRRSAGRGFLARPAPSGPGSTRLPRLHSGTVASPPGPGGPELFLGRYERQ